jgi:hypothetical protein
MNFEEHIAINIYLQVPACTAAGAISNMIATTDFMIIIFAAAGYDYGVPISKKEARALLIMLHGNSIMGSQILVAVTRDASRPRSTKIQRRG